MDGWMDKKKERKSWMNGLMNGEKDRHTDRRMDGWINRKKMEKEMMDSWIKRNKDREIER